MNTIQSMRTFDSLLKELLDLGFIYNDPLNKSIYQYIIRDHRGYPIHPMANGVDLDSRIRDICFIKPNISDIWTYKFYEIDGVLKLTKRTQQNVSFILNAEVMPDDISIANILVLYNELLGIY